MRQLSSCLIEKYSGFTIKKKERKIFKPVDIIYKPTKNIEVELVCYFSDNIAKAYSSLNSKVKKD